MGNCTRSIESLEKFYELWGNGTVSNHVEARI